MSYGYGPGCALCFIFFFLAAIKPQITLEKWEGDRISQDSLIMGRPWESHPGGSDARQSPELGQETTRLLTQVPADGPVPGGSRPWPSLDPGGAFFGPQERRETPTEDGGRVLPLDRQTEDQ